MISAETRASITAVAGLMACGLAGEAGGAEPLEGRGIAVSAVYSADYWHNTRGGLQRGGAYLDNLDLVLDWSGGREPGALRAQVHLVYNNGGSISAKVGDSHVLSNFETDRAVRLLQAWLEFAPGGDTDRSLRAGVYDLNSEFDASEVGGAFLNSTFGMGLDLAQTGVSGPSIFPYTGLALRGRWRVNERWLLQAAVIDGVPVDPDHPRRMTSLSLDGDEGALLTAELEHRSSDWRTVVGHWRYTSRFEELDRVGPVGMPRTGRSNAGVYGFVEGPLAEVGGRALRGVLRLGSASPRYNAFSRTAQAAVLLEQPWLRREGEHLALGIATARRGADVRRAAATAGEPVRSRETLIEITWRAPLGERVVLQPDVQYVLDPGGAPDLRDALVVGLRFEVDLSSR
jgi:porin